MSGTKSSGSCFDSGCFVPALFISIVAFAIISTKLSLGETPLTKAASRGDLAEVQSLVESGASLEKENFFGRTPLEQALRDAGDRNSENYQVAEYLISKGAKFSAAMFDAPILDGNMDFVKEMVDQGFKLDPTNLALYVSFNVIASQKSWDPQFANYLLDNGAEIDINYYDETYKQTYTALGFAVHYRDLEIVKYLVEKGADVNAPMKNGQSPLSLAESEYRVNLDDNAGPGVHYYRIVPPSTEIADYLIQHGAQ